MQSMVVTLGNGQIWLGAPPECGAIIGCARVFSRVITWIGALCSYRFLRSCCAFCSGFLLRRLFLVCSNLSNFVCFVVKD